MSKQITEREEIIESLSKLDAAARAAAPYCEGMTVHSLKRLAIDAGVKALQERYGG